MEKKVKNQFEFFFKKMTFFKMICTLCILKQMDEDYLPVRKVAYYVSLQVIFASYRCKIAEEDNIYWRGRVLH